MFTCGVTRGPNKGRTFCSILTPSAACGERIILTRAMCPWYVYFVLVTNADMGAI